MQITQYIKDIRRNRDTRDYDAYIVHPDGTAEYIGSRTYYFDAKLLCDEYVYQLLRHQPILEAA